LEHVALGRGNPTPERRTGVVGFAEIDFIPRPEVFVDRTGFAPLRVEVGIVDDDAGPLFDLLDPSPTAKSDFSEGTKTVSPKFTVALPSSF
jgi:hypothetical protein